MPDLGRRSRRAVSHDVQRWLRPDRLDVAPRAGRAGDARLSRRGPRPDDPDPTAAMVVEPRKVAPNAIDTSLRTGAQDGLAPGDPRPDPCGGYRDPGRIDETTPVAVRSGRPRERPVRRGRWRHLRH